MHNVNQDSLVKSQSSVESEREHPKPMFYQLKQTRNQLTLSLKSPIPQSMPSVLELHKKHSADTGTMPVSKNSETQSTLMEVKYQCNDNRDITL